MSRLISQDWRSATVDDYPTMASTIFLTSEEFLRHALDVYKLARRDMCPAAGEKWDANGIPWATAEGFYDSLLHHLSERLRRRALLTGHLVETEYDDAEIQALAGAGRSPADMGHGWPAFAPAGGPGCEPSPAGESAHPASPAVIAYPSEPRP